MKNFLSIDIVSFGSSNPLNTDTNCCIYYGYTTSPFGTCFIATINNNICLLQFPGKEDNPLDELKKRWKNAMLVEDITHIEKIAYTIFKQPSTRKISVQVQGTPFQLNVWQTLMEVPFACLLSYEELAIRSGHRKAIRAVASAVARNPIAYLIPCHRIIRKNGEMGNYRWGKEIKKSILDWENKNK